MCCFMLVGSLGFLWEARRIFRVGLPEFLDFSYFLSNTIVVVQNPSVPLMDITVSVRIFRT